MKKLFAICLILGMLLPLVSCGTPKTTLPDNNYPGREENVPAGQLTAGEWNDIEHYEDWLEHFTLTENGEGVFYPYVQENSPWNVFPYTNMKTVTVQVSPPALSVPAVPVAGARVDLLLGEETVYTAVTNAKGNAYLFPQEASDAEAPEYTLRVSSGLYTHEQLMTENRATVQLQGCAEKQNVIELMFVIDTTISMGDELKYIKAEVTDVVGRVKDANEGATVRLALMFYRDDRDLYVTRYFDFTEDIALQQENINLQKAGGGGDVPEAVHIALDEAVSEDWSEEATTKLLFHITDAPPHQDKEVVEVYRGAMLKAAEKGIRIIPVASSGIEKNVEYMLRTEALLTGGTYTFLTDNSGKGSEHMKPSVGEHVVELLNSQMVRLICEYHQGIDIAPVPYEEEPPAVQ